MAFRFSPSSNFAISKSIFISHNAQPNQLAPQLPGSGTVVPRVWLRYWLADDESIVAKVLHDNWGSFK
ncbi:MAG: hypothetical protein GY820_23475, partial [Gammaproteobacteria bacterium]|nr:hypothetical protein [Gammaproteobacteria bacterium]